MPGLPEELQRRLLPQHEGGFRPAAVLIPIVDREADLSVLLTQRALDLPEHGGQVSFPGGRIEPGDEGPADAALRETEEEIGLQRRFVKVVGYLDSYPTSSGYSVSPVVGFVEPGFDLIPDRVEVDSVFEVPLAFLLDPANHKERHEVLAGTRIAYYEITYRCRRIWGVTAGILVSLYQKIKI